MYRDSILDKNVAVPSPPVVKFVVAFQLSGPGYHLGSRQVLVDIQPVYASSRPGPVCMEKGFAALPVNATQAVVTVAVRIWFGSHA